MERQKETSAMGQRREPVVEEKEGKQEVVIVENLPSNEVVVVDDDCDDGYDDDDDDDGDDEEASSVFCVGQSLLGADMRKNQKILYDLRSLMVDGQRMTTRVTIEGR